MQCILLTVERYGADATERFTVFRLRSILKPKRMMMRILLMALVTCLFRKHQHGQQVQTI